jgi:hypothetical protein
MVGFVTIFGTFRSNRDVGFPINANNLNAKSDIALFFTGTRPGLIGLLQHARTITHSVPVNALSGECNGPLFSDGEIKALPSVGVYEID